MTRNSRLVTEDLTYEALPAEVKQRYENNGRLGVAFVKKDGSVRHMSFSKTLKAYQPSAAAKTDAQANYRQNNNLWSGYDVNAYIKAKKETGDDAAAAKQSFRNFKLENVLAFSAGGKVFDMRDENNIVERFGEDVAKALTQTMIQSLERDSAPAAEITIDEPQLDEAGSDNKAKPVSKEDKIAVIKEWIWYTCDEGQAKEDINKYNKMIDVYFADKNDVTEYDFKTIWAKVTEKWGVGDVGADWETFPETWDDVQTGTLTGTY
jgi:hypothetical protein